MNKKYENIKVGDELICKKDYIKTMVISNTETEDVITFIEGKSYKVCNKANLYVTIESEDDNYGHNTHILTEYSFDKCF